MENDEIVLVRVIIQVAVNYVLFHKLICSCQE